MTERLLKKVKSCERGSTALEYGFIAALITIASLGALTAMSSTLIAQWNDTSSKVSSAMN
jgi:pilus assembly protein Flp/PilA